MDIIEFKDCSYKNKHLVGGKCSSLGELFDLQTYLYKYSSNYNWIEIELPSLIFFENLKNNRKN